MRHYLAPLFLVGLGVLVAAVSLYRAGIVGVMGKMGLESMNGERLFDQQLLAQTVENDDWWKCPHELEIVDSLRYYLSTGEQKIVLGWSLGERRLKCGMQMALAGRESEAVYKIMRGGRYLEASLIATANSKSDCRLLPTQDYVSRLEEIVEVARGSAKVTIGKVEESVHNRMRFEHERCIDRGYVTE